VQLAELGVPAVILFGIPSVKDEVGSGAFDPAGIVQVALRELQNEVGNDMVLMSDLCVDEYTSHGHCGVLNKNGDVDNDATLDIYCRAALAQASAGAHVVAPSGMMDGQVGAIRSALDGAGFSDVVIMAYSAKYASGLYGPFRDAVDVQIQGGGNRKGYQQDWRNAREALREVHADIEQGADIVMVKPALSYLDVISAVRAQVDVPVAAYHVSGEYAMIKAAAANGWIDGGLAVGSGDWLPSTAMGQAIASSSTNVVSRHRERPAAKATAGSQRVFSRLGPLRTNGVMGCQDLRNPPSAGAPLPSPRARFPEAFGARSGR
jgi:porphobilinogen synthase